MSRVESNIGAIIKARFKVESQKQPVGDIPQEIKAPMIWGDPEEYSVALDAFERFVQESGMDFFIAWAKKTHLNDARGMVGYDSERKRS